MISIKRELNLTDIEELYKQYDSEPVGSKIDIQLPSEFKEDNIGVLSALIQFIVTVARDEKLGKIKSRLDFPSSGKSIEKAAKNYLWYVVACLHWLKGFEYNTGQSLKPEMKPINQNINDLIRNYVPLGNSYMAVCFDHLAKNAGLLKMFYTPPSYLFVEEEMVEQYVFQIIKNLGFKFNKTVFSQLQPLLKPLTAIIFELFKNTEDWAVKDRFGNKIEPGARGIYFRYYKAFPKQIREKTSNNESLNTYFSHNVFVPDQESKISFLEISVFDSGDGFAGRRLGKEYSVTTPMQDEVDIIKQCLTKYWTNEEGKMQVVKGFGLDKVLSTIDKKGFIRIRTNKASVCRDMILHPYKEEKESNNIVLFDWLSGTSETFHSNYNVRGSLITIILPLDAIPYNS